MTLRLPHLFLVGFAVLTFQCSVLALADDSTTKLSLPIEPNSIVADAGKGTSPALTSTPPPASIPPPPNPANSPNSTRSNSETLEIIPAEKSSGADSEEEQESARTAVASGKAAPLTALLKKLKKDYPGEILNVALHQVHGQYVFNVKYLDRSGLIRIVLLNALTLESQ